jgi:hypothetical protein
MEFQIKFKGVDDWDRPVYKVVDKNVYFGSTMRLVSNDDTIETLNEEFTNNIHLLEYFGTSFNCEPEGGQLEDITLKIIK